MERVAFTIRVKDGQQAEYIRRHHEVWPEVLASLHGAGVHKMSIFMNQSEALVYMEVEDYARAVRILDESPHSIQWEEYMKPILHGASSDHYDVSQAYPSSLPEVFFWEQPDRHLAVPHLRPEGSEGDSRSAPHFKNSKSTINDR